MTTLDRFPNREEVAAHASAYPVTIHTGGMDPRFMKMYGIELNPDIRIQGGVWFLRDLHGIVRASVLSVHTQQPDPKERNAQGVLVWNFEAEAGGYLPELPPADVVIAQSLDGVTGRSTD